MEGSNYFKQFNVHEHVLFKYLEHEQWLKTNVNGLKALKEHIKPNVVAASRGNSKITELLAFKSLDHEQWLKINAVGLKALKEHIKPNVVAASRGNSKITALLAWECTRIVELCTQNPKFAQKYDDCIHDTFDKCVLF